MNMNIQKYIYDALRAAGMTAEGACAVLGNLQAESAFRPNNVEDRSGISDERYTAAVDNGTYSRYQFAHDSYGYGLAQWTYYKRKEWMYDCAKGEGTSIGDCAFQIRFLVREMKRDFASIWSLCCTSNDLYKCTKELLYRWENPYEKENNMVLRYNNAQHWYGLFKDQEPQQYENSEISEPASPTTPEPMNSTWPPRTIDKNCTSWDEYMLLSWLLVFRGYSLKNCTDTSKVFEALMDYQKKNGLDSDGICGPKTWKSLLAF